MENPEGTSSAPTSTRDGWSRGRRGVFAALLASHVGHARVQRALHVGHRGDDLVPVLEDVAEEVRCVVVPGGTAPAGRGPVAIATPEALPFEDESFDLVALFDVIDTVGDDKRALTEARRVLRPGGLLVVCAPAHRWMPTLWLAWRGRRARNYSRRALRLLFARSRVRHERITHVDVALVPMLTPFALLGRLGERAGLLARTPALPPRVPPLPGWLHGILERVFRLELLISTRFDLPLGSSLFAIARRAHPASSSVRRRPRSKLAGILRRVA